MWANTGIILSISLALKIELSLIFHLDVSQGGLMSSGKAFELKTPSIIEQMDPQ